MGITQRHSLFKDRQDMTLSTTSPNGLLSEVIEAVTQLMVSTTPLHTFASTSLLNIVLSI
jgi:hypothetical protein